MFWLEASSGVTVGKIDEGDFAYGKRKPPLAGSQYLSTNRFSITCAVFPQYAKY